MIRASKFDIVMLICIIVAFIGAIVSACIPGDSTLSAVSPYYNSDYSDCSVGWRNEYGKNYFISSLYENKEILSVDKPFYLYRTIESEKNDMILCMRTHDLVVNIYDNDVLVYKSGDNGRDGVLPSFDNYISVPIENNSSFHEIKLEIFKTTAATASCIDCTYLGNATRIMNRFTNIALPSLIFSTVAIVLGLFFIVFGSMLVKHVERSIGCIYFGFFLFMISVPMFLDTPLTYMFVGNVGIIENVSRFCLFGSVPALMMFILTFFDVSHDIVLKILTVISFVFCAASMVLNYTGVLPFTAMIVPFHILIVLGAIIISFELIHYISKVMGDKHDISRVFYIGLVFYLAFVIYDVIRYYQTNSSDSFFGLRSGLFILIVTSVAMCFGDVAKYVKLGVKAGKLNEVAFTDANTGLGNSAAFKAKMAQLEARRINYNCIGIIQFDVNNLKVINDTKGHEMGDLLIMKAADVISKSFGEIGSCYRVGGDEFVAITTYNHAASACEEAIGKFEDILERFNQNPNRPFDLRIAYGIAYYTADMGYTKTLKEIHKIADQRMYSKKKEMKARYAKTAAEAEVR